MPTVTRAEIAEALRDLALEMRTLGTAMDYYGGFDTEMSQHGRELFGAGLVAADWAKHIKESTCE